MKTVYYILLSFISFAGFAQQNPPPSWTYVGNQHFSTGEAIYTSLAISPSGVPYIGFYDGSLSGKATVMKFSGNTWVNVGNAGFSTGTAHWESLAFNPVDGQPYLAFRDDARGGKATVMKFDGVNWINVGNPGFSSACTDWESLAFDPSGVPYLAFTDYTSGGATVMKFDGTNWVIVGTAGFSLANAACTSLAFNSAGQPYVAYSDGSVIPWNSITVKKFNGTNWVTVGNPGFTSGFAWGGSLAFSPSDEPYIGFIDNADSAKTSVMKFNGTSWVYVGVRGFSNSAGYINSEGLAFNPANGQPYVGYQDTLYSGKATVMTFNGTQWVNVGNPGFSADYTQTVSLAFDQSGQTYVAFGEGTVDKATVMKYNCNNPPNPTISGSGNLCVNSGFFNYNTESGMNNYQWNVSPGGTITYGQGSNVAQVVWGQPGNQWISVNYSDNTGCTAQNPTIYPVTVNPLPDSSGSITGPSVICGGSTGIEYSIAPVANSVIYIWTLPEGWTITSGSGTDHITVDFADSASSGDITVNGNNLCGNGIPSSLAVTVNPLPPVPVISPYTGYSLISSAPIGNQWYFAPFNIPTGSIIPGATNHIFDVYNSETGCGDYWTMVTINGCSSDTSNHITVCIEGTRDNYSEEINIIPVPNDGHFTLMIPDTKSMVDVSIFNSLGNKILEKTFHDIPAKQTIDIRPAPAGVYSVIINDGKRQSVKRMIVE